MHKRWRDQDRRRVARMMVFGGCLAMAACGGGGEHGSGAMTGGNLARTSWLAEDIDGRGVIDNAQSSLDVREDGQVSGNTACNPYAGQATITGDRLAFGPLATTRRACPPAVMDQEQRFLEALGASQGYRIEGSSLVIHDAGGRALVRFTRVPSPA